MDANEKTLLFKGKELAIKTALDLQKINPKDDFNLFKEAQRILEFINEHSEQKRKNSKEEFMKIAEKLLHNNTDNESHYIADKIISTLEVLDAKIRGKTIIMCGRVDSRASLLDRLNDLY